MPILENRPEVAGLGVVNGDASDRLGESDGATCVIDESERLGVSASRELSCLAVMPRYFDAREPAVILLAIIEPGVDGANLAIFTTREREAGVVPGVTRPADVDGVILPIPEGVTRPFEREVEGVARIGVEDENEGVTRPEIDGVARPLRDEATDEGR
jgi:hypothetical protein